MSLSLPETCSSGPVLSLDVIDDRTFLPCQKRRNYESNTLAAARRSKCQEVFRTVVSKVLKPSGALVVPTSDVDSTGRLQQASGLHILRGGPAGGAVQILGTFGQASSAPAGNDVKHRDR